MPDTGPDRAPHSVPDRVPDKASLRKELLLRRDSIPPEVRKVKNSAIHSAFFALDEIENAATLFFFASFRSEVDTTEMIRHALAAGKRVILPKVVAEGRLALYQIMSTDELLPGFMGIPEPSESSGLLCSINDVEVVIIPGACYDETGNRVGYGGGYYDRLLAEIDNAVPIIAPAYEEQIVAEVPAEPHDRKVNIIVTDRRIIRCVTGPG